MFVRVLLSVLLLAALGRADKLPQQVRAISPPDSYLPPAKEYLPPPGEYLPPPGEYLPPPGEYLPPTQTGGRTPSTGAGAGAGVGLIQPPPASFSSVVEAAPFSQAPQPDAQKAVVVDQNSAHPGFCPRRQLTRSCLRVKSAPTDCFSDADCDQRQKCCALDCGLQCADAVLKPSSCDKVVCSKLGDECVDLESGPTCIGHSKPGQCPFHGQYCSNRILKCKEDSDCEGEKLCCNLSCHRLCVDPVSKEKHLGFCPLVAARPPTRCGVQCETDDDCSSDTKCCDNACGRVCQPGVVPFITCENRNCPPNTRCQMEGLEAICKTL